jgi:hypothetical protein
MSSAVDMYLWCQAVDALMVLCESAAHRTAVIACGGVEALAAMVMQVRFKEPLLNEALSDFKEPCWSALLKFLLILYSRRGLVMQSDFGAPGQQSAAYTVSRLAGDAEQVGAAMQKFAIVTSGFGTARQKLALEWWTNLKPFGVIVYCAAI